MTAPPQAAAWATCLLAVAAVGRLLRVDFEDHASSTTGPRSTTTAPPTTLGSRRCWRLVAGGLSRGGPDASRSRRSTSGNKPQHRFWWPPRELALAAARRRDDGRHPVATHRVSPAQQATSERDRGIIRPACAALGFPVPDLPFRPTAPALCAIGVVRQPDISPEIYEPAVTAIGRVRRRMQVENAYATLHTARVSRLRQRSVLARPAYSTPRGAAVPAKVAPCSP